MLVAVGLSWLPVLPALLLELLPEPCSLWGALLWDWLFWGAPEKKLLNMFCKMPFPPPPPEPPLLLLDEPADEGPGGCELGCGTS